MREESSSREMRRREVRGMRENRKGRLGNKEESK